MKGKTAPHATRGGEKIENCKKRNLVYESICAKCNPGAMEMKGEWKPKMGAQSLYVGETCRSLHERSKEHMEAFKQGSKDSHVLKHHVAHHQGEGEPKMMFRAVKYYSTALGRQIGEATRIRRRGASSLLNSKGEYNRCKITRLTLEESEGSNEEQKGEVQIEEINKEGAKWEREKALIRELESRRERGGRAGVLETIREVTKRKKEILWEQGKSKRKRQFARVGELWGEQEEREQITLDKPRGEKEIYTAEKVKKTPKKGEGGWRNSPPKITENKGSESSPLQTIAKSSEGRNGGISSRLVDYYGSSTVSNTQGSTVQRPIGEENGGDEQRSGECERGDSLQQDENECGSQEYPRSNYDGEQSSNEVSEHSGSSNNERDDQNCYDDKCGESKNRLREPESNEGDERDGEGTTIPDSVMCEVKKGFCIIHQEQARKVKNVWKEWAKNNRTGLFGFRQRQSTIWRCRAGLAKPTCHSV